MDEKDQLRTAELVQLHQDIHEGLDSGRAIAWDPTEITREGRAKRLRQDTRCQSIDAGES